MSETQSGKRSWARTGCIGAAAVALIVILIAIGASSVALLQNRSEAPELVRLEQPIPVPVAATTDAAEVEDVLPPTGRVLLDVAVCQLTVVPGPEGSPIQVEGLFESGRFDLQNATTTDADGGWTTRVSLRPLQSESWELFRVKLGGVLPRLRISLPPDVPIEIVGDVRKGLAALELGGLWVRSAEFNVRGGNVDLSFSKPTREPMESITIDVYGGALEIGPMGNASPARVTLSPRLGAIDLDLRGPWQRDGYLSLEGNTAGGSIWLPTDMRIEGVDRPPPRPGLSPEIDPFTLHLDIETPSNRIILID